MGMNTKHTNAAKMTQAYQAANDVCDAMADLKNYPKGSQQRADREFELARLIAVRDRLTRQAHAA
jgi:hypothetical protein